ncbi:Mmp37-domain-containing protein [Punctularia strigosozonata HHB-11173 SS5]|uniref:Mmp37-domain-containing protein n=1 Tax=Punctularia strigosozonata (strain HHB-11173) TaxID=741275 RepID=UPI0004416CF8|nr:Mmp37-domain-containing protein [Punctularia strigosozonata HHB-11173 SS5]EIN12746.1 Mmp37-domain-containing protein [Punctularia strigosozonata HHB-11173 SS5]
MLSNTSRTSCRTLRSIAARHYATETTTTTPSHTPHPPPPKTHSTTPRPRARFNPAPRTTTAKPPPFLPYLSPNFGRNQLLNVPDATRALLEDIVRQFDAPIRYAFAYGSGVFEQDGYAPRKDLSEGPMVDFIFAVTHADHWHYLNMHQYPGHYAFHSRILGSSFVSKVQQISPGVWFNPYVRMNGVTIKYGVITVDDLCSDLLNWRTLYTAGRMHKPIRIIKDDARVRLTQQVNLVSAVRASLLTLPPNFSEAELFERIAGLSYRGDPRMLLPAENRDKVKNIVHKQSPQFKELYYRLVTGLPGVHWAANSTHIEQDTSPQARALHLRKLPSNLLARLTSHYAANPSIPSKEADEAVYWTKLAGDENIPTVLQDEIDKIVRYPAVVQTAKGIVSAGVLKSARYVGGKVGKWLKGSSSAKQASP